MKRKFLIVVLSLSALLLSSASLFLLNNKDVVKVEAYNSNSLPTTIDLNDTSESNIRNYYSSLNNLSTNEREGTNLLKNLKTILKNGQKYYSYDSGSSIWKIYEITDRDWDKSPASEISGYNPSTNKITGYVYGTSYSSPGTNPYLHALYVDRNVENLMRAWKKDNDTYDRNNHGNNAEWYIDREHIWAKSAGFENSGQAGARGDPMHLWPGDSAVNSDQHSNYYFGYVKNVSSSGKWSYASNNKMGSSLTISGHDSINVFEPQDSDKGDIARACFYMVARYNYLSGSDSDGIDNNNPNLEMVNNLTSWQNAGYQSTTSLTGKMGILQDLLEWNRLDPPDEWEIHRNNLCYNNFTNNRNPFIDFPEWAEYIWGKSVDGNYDSSSTGYALPNSNTINGFSDEEATSLTATVNKTYYVGETITTSDISVVDNLGNTITDFSFVNNNYQFVYDDASSGGALTDKTFADAISYNNMTCSLAVQVQRKAREQIITVSDTLDRTFTGVTTSTYASWNNKKSTSSAIYAGHSAGGNESIQLRSTQSSGGDYSGIITTTSGGPLKSVSVTWNSNTSTGRTLNVYGKNSAYSSPNDLYSDSESTRGTLLGTIVKGSSTSINVTGIYTYVGVCSNKDAMYISEIVFVYGGEDTALNLANYIMYEDTNGQCDIKFDIAKGYFENLSSGERNLFMTSDNYVISSAKERFEAWAKNQGKEIIYLNNDYVFSAYGITFILFYKSNDIFIHTVVIISTIWLLATIGYIYHKKRKKHER